MYSTTLILTSTLVALSTASAIERRTDNTCNTGPVQCCQNTQLADAPFASQLLALLGVGVQDVNVPVGIACNPITGIGAGSAGWYVLLSSLPRNVL